MPELERELRDLAVALDWPATPDLAPAVRRRIAEEPAPRRAGARPAALVVALAVLAVAVGAVLAVPSARTAVLEWLGLRGVTVERVETLPTAPEKPDELGVGELVSADEASVAGGLPVARPHAGRRSASPTRSATRPPSGTARSPTSGAARTARVETLLTVFEAEVDDGFIGKMVGLERRVPSRSTSRAGARSGSRRLHFFMYELPSGEARDETRAARGEHAPLGGRNPALPSRGRLHRGAGDRDRRAAHAVGEPWAPPRCRGGNQAGGTHAHRHLAHARRNRPRPRRERERRLLRDRRGRGAAGRHRPRRHVERRHHREAARRAADPERDSDPDDDLVRRASGRRTPRSRPTRWASTPPRSSSPRRAAGRTR